MSAHGGRGRISHRERIARAALGMSASHPELLTRKPGRAEWRQLTTWLGEMWPNDEYAAIVAETLRHNPPPGTQDWR